MRKSISELTDEDIENIRQRFYPTSRAISVFAYGIEVIYSYTLPDINYKDWEQVAFPVIDALRAMGYEIPSDDYDYAISSMAEHAFNEGMDYGINAPHPDGEFGFEQYKKEYL